MALIVSPNPWLITGWTKFIQYHKAVLNEIKGSLATTSGEFNPSKPMLSPAGP
jgi:hypothetical protein